ncbi:hypothetical protein [Paraburkholderia flagellata]|uniref:hypothetical protein n=1 Tax=Paraburkholderia flagellata TaxID=2883241 RepID=UPI001F32698C|nr:hypothetical protein [Paraburkholderia flagellata]
MVTLLKGSDVLPESAESAFRSAFERLKVGKPVRLSVGTAITQASVAQEAGCDPSALRKSRYPLLISEIQRWQRDNPPKPAPSQRQLTRAKREQRRDDRARLSEVVKQRDSLASLLMEADTKIVELVKEIAELKERTPKESSNVANFPGNRSRRNGL